MNYIKHLTGFFNQISLEQGLFPTHISLYMTLFQSWNINRFRNPIVITRDEIMKSSRIASKATYHKCMKDLENLGLLTYEPTYNPYVGTQITMINLSDKNKTAGNNQKSTCSIIEQTIPLNEHIVEPLNEPIDERSIYNNKTSKNINKLYIEKNKNVKKSTSSINEQVFQKEMITVQKEKKKIPSLKKVTEYFIFQKSSEFEAERFFNYYSSNGWLIGGKTKMEDWKASARNWMLNTNKFTANLPKQVQPQQINRALNLHTETDKNYSEPL